ncbi:MAG: hypothetical protein IJ013_03035 [Bacteroidaceae bacterium]|nr:hypothetical protein [Bacteroidaceae bacterium]
MSITKHTILILLALATALFTACRDEEAVISSEATDGELVISCQVADFVVTSNNATRAVADALGVESENTIHKLDLLVFDGETCLCHLNSSSDQALNRVFTTDTDGDATWDVTNLLPKDYLSNAAYTHVLVANCPEGHLSKDLTLTKLKQLVLNNTAFDPYAEQTTAGIPMVQILEPATGTRSEFDEATLTLTFNALERVAAKVQVVTQEVEYDGRIVSDFEDLEAGTLPAGWIAPNGGINFSTISRNNSKGFLASLQANTRNIYYNLSNAYADLYVKSWTLEFYWAGNFGNTDNGLLQVYGSHELELFYISIPTGNSNTDAVNATIYNSSKEAISGITLEAKRFATTPMVWYHFTLTYDGNHVYLKIKNESDSETILEETVVSTPDSPIHAGQINLLIGRGYAQQAIDDITYSYELGFPGTISSYKLINYLDDGYLYNDDASSNYANDKRIDDTSERAFKNEFADGEVSLTDFNEWGTNSTMQGSNGFALYCYPNYWFDNENYQAKYEGMHKYQPILEDRQTYLLVKAKYIDQATGVLSSKEYYYKIPINSRLSEWNDIYTNSALISDGVCAPIIDAVWETSVSSFDDFTEEQKATVYQTMQTQLSQATFPVYKDKDGNSLTTSETTLLHDNLLKAILDALYNSTTPPASDSNITDDEKKNVINPAIREAVAYGRIKEETEENCRLQRNHHYIIYASFDHAGGETADEAFYFATEPFYDVVLRPQF